MRQVFESDTIRFVTVDECLVGDYLAMVNDIENVARLIGLTEPVSEEKEFRWVRKKLEEKAPVYSMLEKKTGDFIGNVELMDAQEGVAELGIAITAKKQNAGLGQEAVRAVVEYAMDQLDLNRVFLKVFPDNARAIHVYEKCGFREYDRTGNDVFMEITRGG